jgi:hypothetical protein
VNLAIDFTAPPTVADFMASCAFCRLIVGPVGSGKSSGCNMEFLRRALEQKPGPDGVRRTRFVAVRNTYPELRDTTRKTFEQWVGNPLESAGLGSWMEREFTFHIRFGDVDCEVLFRALDDADDVKKLLSLELTGAYINEWREVPGIILAGLKARVGRFPAMKDGGPTWYGIWGDTNPMAVGSELHDLFKVTKPEDHEIYEQPSALGPDAENLSNLVPGYYRQLCSGQSAEWVAEYAEAKYPRNDKGSIYGEKLALLEDAGCMAPFEHPTDGVFATFDLGFSDATAIWFWRFNGHGVDFIDWYENSGKALSHYFDEVDRRTRSVDEGGLGWTLRKVIIPHDARAGSLQTGVSIEDMFNDHFDGGRVEIIPALDVNDGIEATRYLFEQVTRFHPRVADGLKRLKSYKYKFDLNTRVFSKTPLHDWTSHTADAARYVALYVKRAEFLTRQDAPKKPKGKVRGPTWDEMVAAKEAEPSERRIG